MPAWEYMVKDLTLGYGSVLEELREAEQEDLNFWGNKGWEFVAVRETSMGVRMYYKRPKETE